MTAIAVTPPLYGLAVLVTGASGGIGRALVHAIAHAGAHPIIHYARNEEGASALLKEVDDQGWILQADLSSPEGAADLWMRAETVAGRIHGLVNNAGVRIEAKIDGELLAWQKAWEQDLRVNLQAPVDLCRCAIHHFRRHGGGRIINIASRAAQRGYTADFMPYGASKAALINVTKSLARNYGAEGVISIAIAPGFVNTDMADDYVRKHGMAAATGDIPIHAMAEPKEIADLVVFCLHPAQRSLNGATLDVNGGSYVR